MKAFKQVALAVALIAALASDAHSQTRSPAAAPAWPQAASDLPADPSVVFGVLPNGMRYALRRNTRPEHQVSMRLRIAAGSGYEEADQRGLAHVLEHMAFRGSTHFPERAGEYEAVAALQRIGLSFGGDTNAYTAQTETVYMFDLPKSDPESLTTGLALLRDIGGELSLSNASLDAERPIVLAEERARTTPTYTATVQNYELVYRDEPMAKMALGSVEVIKSAPLARVRAFYEKYYRPERATLVIVGDIDPIALEARIKTLFGDWKGKGPSPAPEGPAALKSRQPEFLISTMPGVTAQLILSWKSPYDWSPDTMAASRTRFVQSLALAVFNQRLTEATLAPGAPFALASASRNEQGQAALVTQIVILPARGGDWGPALDKVTVMKKQALTFGLQQVEVDRILVTMRANLQNAMAGAGTRPSSGLASQLVNSAPAQRVITSPETELALFDDWAKTLTLAEVNAGLAQVFAGQGVLAQLITPSDIPGGQAAFSARYAAADATPVTAMAAQAVKTWAHTSFGAPGRVVERQEAADLGVTFVRFANGVRAAIKPTKFTTDQILVQARFSGGRYSLPREKVDAGWLWANGFISGGLTDLTQVELGQVMAGRRVGINAAIGDNAFMLSGQTRLADLDGQMQLLTAFVAAPGWRETALDQAKSLLPTLLPTLSAQPAGLYTLQGEVLMHGGDRRWAQLPTVEELNAMTMADARILLTPVLKNAPLELVVVGDVTVDQAIEALSKTFGALPERKGAAAKNGQAVKPPPGGGAPAVLTHKGRPDQGLFIITWPTTDYWKDPKASASAKTLEMILTQRVIDALRSSGGKTYSPQGDAAFSYYFDGYGYITQRIEAPAADMAGIEATIRQIAADLRSKLVTADELSRARTQRAEYWRRTQATNGYWLQALYDARKEAPLLDAARNAIPRTEAVTAADVQASANKWLADGAAWRLQIVHE